MRDHDDLAGLALLIERFLGELFEMAVADRGHLVDQEVVKVKRHTQGKAQATAHARGIVSDRLVKVVADL